MWWLGIGSHSDISGTTGNGRIPAPSTLFPPAATARHIGTTDSTSQTLIQRHHPNPRYRRSVADLRVQLSDPRASRHRSHADLGIMRQAPYPPHHPSYPDNRGFVLTVSGLRPTVLGSFSRSWGFGRTRWVRFGRTRSEAPICPGGGSVRFLSFMAPDHLHAERSVGDGAWYAPWRAGDGAVGPRRRPSRSRSLGSSISIERIVKELSGEN
jgi:hypothetical protein